MYIEFSISIGNTETLSDIFLSDSIENNMFKEILFHLINDSFN